jgi:PAS domain S-box-containing protein
MAVLAGWPSWRSADGALTPAQLALLVLLMALGVIEPTVRAVRRQHRRLAVRAEQLERLALVAERTANPMVVTDAACRVAWCNRAFQSLCGAQADALVGRLLSDVLGLCGMAPAALAPLRSALDQRQGLRLTLQRPGADGALQCLDLDLQPASDASGQLGGFVAVLIDVTEQVTQRLRTEALLAALPNGVVMRSAEGRVLECNPAAEQQLRLSRDQLLGHAPIPAGWKTVHDDLRAMPLHERPAIGVLNTGRGVQGAIMGVVSPEASLRWLLVNAEPIHDALGRPAGTVSCFTDVTGQRNQQAVLAHTVDAAGLGSWQWDMRSGEMVFNDRLLAMLGYRQGEVVPNIDQWTALVHPDDIATWRAALRVHLADPAIACRSELRVRRPDGDWAAVQSCGVVIEREGSGAPRRMAGINIDMTEQMQLQAMLRHAARTDGLTQLPNRAAVFDQVQQAINRCSARAGFEYAVLFMDFDRFKQINDTLGHAAGDELLRQIAQRLRGALRQGDAVGRSASHLPSSRGAAGAEAAPPPPSQMAGRIGGDEFVVVLEGVQGRDEACAVARRLMEVLALPYRINNQVVHSTASIGIVTSEHPANDANTVMRDADTAMYEAKRGGRDRYVVFDPAMHERVARSVETEADLRLALQRGELFVVYQPVVELQQDGPGSVEALVRWRHPRRGLVNPADFIPVAEESGLIVELGAFVLATACRQLVAWQHTLGLLAPSALAVNLSPVQLRMPGLIAEVQRCLADSGLAPAALQLEVTESLAAQDDNARARLKELKALGIRIALDDFGTGYSSLACLHQLPVDTVKIDRSFVMYAETSDYHRVLIEATIRVAETLGMDTVAEGIETAGQAALMRRLHCGRGQGYLWARPLEADALCLWLTRRAVPLATAA